MTKTEQAIMLLQQGELAKALTIIAKFRIGFTKDELRTLSIARDSLNGHAQLYEQIGIDTSHEISRTMKILEKKYTNLHIFSQKVFVL